MPLLSTRNRRLLEYALFRWESATLISSTALLTALSWFFRYLPEIPDRGWLGALAFGLISEGLLLLSSYFDPASRARVDEEEEREGGSAPTPPAIQTPALREEVEKAVDYYRRILKATEKRANSPLKAQFSETLGQIRDWLRTIFRLAERLDLYYLERDGLGRDQQQAEKRLRELSRRLREAESPEMRVGVQETMAALGEQLRTHKTLEETMEQARLRLEHTLSALSTIYSQTLLIDFKDAEGGQVHELREEIAGEKAVLDAILGAMEQVYQVQSQA